MATALASGFTPAEISFNAGMLSDRDLAFVAETTVHCTLDSFSALRRYGERAAPGASSKTIALASRSSTLKPRDFSSSLRDSASASTKR